MQQNQPQKTQLKPTTKPPLPAPSQSHKRLLVNSNPNPNFTTPSPQSSISSDSSEDDPRKKTRDLPNLYDCHSCNRHVNFSNPSDKLRILESAWRVVWLCKECIRCVELGKDCSYCLSSVSGFECFKCGNCDRLVHKECVGKYGVCPPWSYCPLEMRFKLCVDCWVPNSVKRKGKGMQFEVLEDCVREAECVAGKKFEVSVKAKEDALRKRDVARKAVDYASGVLKRDGLEDGDLALQLHRAMNSSPRISRSFGPVNYSCLGGGKSRKLGFFGKIKVREDKELSEVLEVRMNSDNVGCENGKGLRDDGDIGMAKEGVVGICSPGVGNGKNSVVRYYQRRNKQRQMLQSVTRSAQSVDKNFQPGLKCYQRQRRNKLKRVLESEVKSTQSARDRVTLYYSRRKHDRFMSKYRRRNLGSKVVTYGQRRNLYDSLRLHEYVLALPTPSKCPTN